MSKPYDIRTVEERLFQQYLSSYNSRHDKKLDPIKGRVIFDRQREENRELALKPLIVAPKHEAIEFEVGSKTCEECGHTKLATEFTLGRIVCKECANKQIAETRRKRRVDFLRSKSKVVLQMTKDGIPNKVIRAEVGVSFKAISEILLMGEDVIKSVRKKMTSDERRLRLIEAKPKILEMKKQGLNYDKISKKLGVSKDFYYQALKMRNE